MRERAFVPEAAITDIDGIVELWTEHLDFPAQLDTRFERRDGSGYGEHLREKVGDNDFLLLVAIVEDRVVGFLSGELSRFPPCFVHRDHGVIIDLAVTSRYRRQGVGAALLEEAMAWFVERDVPTVETRVLMANPLAMEFWNKAGFRPNMQTIRTSTERHD
jgi:ribosomal protein S18 acetylase RimI-like enzyme